jgi:hypothetical protein
VIVDIPNHHFSRRSSSACAKKADAVRRISFARRSSRFSRPSVFYRWRAVADNGSAVALKRDAKRRPRKDELEARQKAEIDRLRAVVAEITAENLELKKKI